MTKIEVLDFFAKREIWRFPDDVWRHFEKKSVARVSVYTFLLRIWKQKLLSRTLINKRIAYAISAKGNQRLVFLRDRESKNAS